MSNQTPIDKKERNRDYGRKHMNTMREAGHQRVNFWLEADAQEIIAKAVRHTGKNKQELFNRAVRLLGEVINEDIEKQRRVRETLESMKQ